MTNHHTKNVPLRGLAPLAPLALALALVLVLAAACGSTSDTAESQDVDIAETEDAAQAAPDPEDSDEDADEAVADSVTDSDGTDADGTDADGTDADGTEADGAEEPWPDPPSVWQDFQRTRQAELAHYAGQIQALLGLPLPQRVEPGEYTTLSLDLHLDFSISRPHALIEENPGHVLLANRPAGDSTLYFLRPVGAYMDDAVLDANALFAGRGIAAPLPEDLQEWADHLPDITVSSAEPATVAGLDAQRFDLSLPQDLGYFCQQGTCANLFPSGAAIQGFVGIQGGQSARVWEVELEGTDLIIVAKTPTDSGLAWFDEVDEIVDSLRIDDVKPSRTDSVVWDPRGYAPAGTHQWAGVDWVTTSFDDQLEFFNVDGLLTFNEIGVDVWFQIARIETSMTGASIESVDSFSEVLTEELGLTSIEPIDPIVLTGAAGDLVGSWRIFDESTTANGRSWFHFAGLPDGERWERGAFLTSAYTEVHVFNRAGQLWLLSMDSTEPEAAEGMRAFGERLLAQIDFEPADDSAIGVVPPSGDLEPGTWQTGFDPDVSFSLAEAAFAVAVNDGGVILIQDRDTLAQHLPLRWIAIARPTGFAMPAELTAMPEVGGYSLAADEFDSWLAAMTAEDGDGPRAEAQIGSGEVAGLEATIVDLEVTPDRVDTIPGGCGADRCYGFMTMNSAIDPLVVRPGEHYRIWVVHDADLVLMAAVATGDEVWLDDTASVVVSTLVAAES